MHSGDSELIIWVVFIGILLVATWVYRTTRPLAQPGEKSLGRVTLMGKDTIDASLPDYNANGELYAMPAGLLFRHDRPLIGTKDAPPVVIPWEHIQEWGVDYHISLFPGWGYHYIQVRYFDEASDSVGRAIFRPRTGWLQKQKVIKIARQITEERGRSVQGLKQATVVHARE